MTVKWKRRCIDILLTKKVKECIRAHYRGICQYCFEPSGYDVEHIVPQAGGGTDTLGNATLACKRCNSRKSDTHLDPMFVAIAHARAREAAPKIAARLRNPAMVAAIRKVVEASRAAFGNAHAAELTVLLQQDGLLLTP